MAEQAKGFRWREARKRASRRGQSSPYPWDDWFDGTTWLLIRGEDFDKKPETMRQTVHRAAKQRGVRVRTHIEDGDLYVQRTHLTRRQRRSYRQIVADLKAAEDARSQGDRGGEAGAGC